MDSPAQTGVCDGALERGGGPPAAALVAHAPRRARGTLDRSLYFHGTNLSVLLFAWYTLIDRFTFMVQIDRSIYFHGTRRPDIPTTTRPDWT